MNSIYGIPQSADIMRTSIAGRTSQAEPVKETSGVTPDEKPSLPKRDEYVPEEPRKAAGLYRLGRDEDGERRIIFDAPVDAGVNPADGPEKTSPNKSEEKEAKTCIGSTDKVDREISKLKAKLAGLEKKLSQSKDNPMEQAELEKQITEIENELRVKDTDSYRRQHSEFRRLA